MQQHQRDTWPTFFHIARSSCWVMLCALGVCRSTCRAQLCSLLHVQLSFWKMHVEGGTILKIEARLANFGSCAALYQWSFFNEEVVSVSRNH